MADQLAKKGCTLIQKHITQKSFISVKFDKKFQYKQNFFNRIKESVKDKSWEPCLQNSNIIPEEPRNSAVAAFRLLTGHDCLAAHLYRIGISLSPNCVLGGKDVIMDKYQLENCEPLPVHLNITEQYWTAKWLIASSP